MATFLRVQLAHHDGTERPGDVVLVNVDSITRVHPAWPSGCTLVTADASLHIKASFQELTLHLIATGGNVMVKHVEAARPA